MVGEKGATGAHGATGAVGPQGIQGPAGFSGYKLVQKEYTLGAELYASMTEFCDAGKVVVGGGVNVSRAPRKIVTNFSGPVFENGRYGWNVAVSNTSTDTARFIVTAICSTAS